MLRFPAVRRCRPLMPAAASSSNIASASIAAERVLVLDFGSQYAQLIARRVREQHVYCEIVRHDITAERVRELAPEGADPLRRPGERVRRRRAASAIRRFSSSAFPCSASATACS